MLDNQQPLGIRHCMTSLPVAYWAHDFRDRRTDPIMDQISSELRYPAAVLGDLPHRR
jgi:hypothetical protein